MPERSRSREGRSASLASIVKEQVRLEERLSTSAWSSLASIVKEQVRLEERLPLRGHSGKVKFPRKMDDSLCVG